jgi:hypothetical protein
MALMFMAILATVGSGGTLLTTGNPFGVLTSILPNMGFDSTMRHYKKMRGNNLPNNRFNIPNPMMT